MTVEAFGPDNIERARHPIIVVMGVSGCGKFSVELLGSQFRALEDPRGEPNVVRVSIEPEPAIVAEHAASVLHAHHGFATAMAATTAEGPTTTRQRTRT